MAETRLLSVNLNFRIQVLDYLGYKENLKMKKISQRKREIHNEGKRFLYHRFLAVDCQALKYCIFFRFHLALLLFLKLT